MTQVDFYILNKQSKQDQYIFACRLLEKAQQQGNRVLIQTDNEQSAKELDKLIWEFNPNAFLPHTLLTDTQLVNQSPIAISWQETPAHHDDIIINLSQNMPSFYSRFKRYIGIVVQEDQVLAQTRRHFKFLKDRGYQINTHDLRIR